jgi:peptide/nickel transport system substrate-binding protein
MKLRRTIGGVVLLALLSGAALSGTALAQSDEPSGTDTPASDSGSESTFIFGDTSEPSSLNPMVGYLGTDYTLWAMTYDIPINYTTEDFAANLDQSIVTSVDASEDGMSFTYHMRPDMKWSDGEPFTADDVEWTMNYYKDNEISNYSADLALMDRVEATDETTFVLHSTEPTSVYSGDSVFLYEYILPKHIWAELDSPKKFENVPAVGSGPYVITEYKQGDSVTLEQNPNYWGKEIGLEPTVDRIIYKVFQDENQEAAALEKGEIDFGYFDSANILKALDGKPNVTTHAAITPSFDELAFNTGSAFQPADGKFEPHGDGSHAAADPAFRRAIRMAVDSQTIVDKVLQGYGEPALSPVPPDSVPPGIYWAPPEDEQLSFNLDNAKQALTDAGYTDTDGDGIVNDPETGDNVVLRYFIRSSDQNSVKTAPYVEGWLKEIGVGVDLQSVGTSKLGHIIEDGTYDLFHWGWFPSPDPNSILFVFKCEERPPEPGVYGNNDSYFCDEEYDKLSKDQLSTTSVDDRIDIVHRMQEILYDKQPYIMLYYSKVLQAYRSDRFTDYTQQPAQDGDLLATYGPFSFISIKPVDGTNSGGNSSSSSSGIPVVVWILVGVAIVVVGGFLIARSRRGSDEDRA